MIGAVLLYMFQKAMAAPAAKAPAPAVKPNATAPKQHGMQNQKKESTPGKDDLEARAMRNPSSSLHFPKSDLLEPLNQRDRDGDQGYSSTESRPQQRKRYR